MIEPTIANPNEPTRRELADWVVKLIRERAPPEHGNVEWDEIEKVVGLQRGDVVFSFVIQDAIDEMIESQPSWLFQRDAKFGLVRLSESDRISYCRAKRRRMERQNRRALTIINTSDVTKLDDIEKQELARERLRQIHLRREMERVKAKKWLSATEGDQKELPGSPEEPE